MSNVQASKHALGTSEKLVTGASSPSPSPAAGSPSHAEYDSYFSSDPWPSMSYVFTDYKILHEDSRDYSHETGFTPI